MAVKPFDLNAYIATYRSRAGSAAARTQGAPGPLIAAAVAPAPPSVLTLDMTPEQARHVPQSVYEGARYGLAIPKLAVLPAGIDQLVLPKPSNTRTWLFIFNGTIANIYLNFDQAADVFSAPIPPGGNAFFDFWVPQNDIHLFSVAAANVPVYYANGNVSSSMS